MDRDQRWVRLGRLLQERRIELGFKKRTAFATAKGFPNTRVLAAIENAERQNFDRSTLVSIAIAYEWTIESIERVLEGGDPVPAGQAPTRVPESAFDLIPNPMAEDAEDSEWVQAQGRSDSRDYLRGTSVMRDASGRSTRVELRFWPASDDQYVSMGGFSDAVAQAHRAAIGAQERSQPLPAEESGLEPLEFARPDRPNGIPPVPADVAADDPGIPTMFDDQHDAEHGDDNQGR